MSNHYYSHQTTTKSHEQTHRVFIDEQNTLQLITDHGVFSKTGLDFGSKTLIQSFPLVPIVDGDILDVGCGYGPMGISASLTYHRFVDMVDVNERAIALANRNIALNGAKGHAFLSSVYDNVQKMNYALIISNPPIRAGKEIVHRIIEKSYDHLTENGKLMIVIQKKQGAPSAQKKMLEVFGNVEEVERQKGYWVLVSTKTK